MGKNNAVSLFEGKFPRDAKVKGIFFGSLNKNFGWKWKIWRSVEPNWKNQCREKLFKQS